MIFKLIFAAFILLFLSISFYYGKKSASLKDFYNMGGTAGPWLIAGTYTATWVSAVGMVGITGAAYKSGPLMAILIWGAFTGFIISAFFIGPKLRRFGQVTLGDYFEARFQSPFIRCLSSVVTLIGLGAYFISQLVGSAVITEGVLGIPFNVMLPLMVAVFAIIAITGGARSVTITDTIMFAMVAVFIGFIFSPMIIAKIGIENISFFAKSRPSFFTATGGVVGWGTILGWQVLWGLGNAANPAAITRAYLAKDSRTWTEAIMIALMVTIPVVWLSHVAAGVIPIVNPDLANPSTVLVWAASNKELVPPVIGALAIAGLFAAVLSTASTQILTLGFSISRDIYERFYVKEMNPTTEAKLLRFSRFSIAAIAIISVLISWGRPTIVLLIGNFGSSVFAAAFFPVLVLGLWWGKSTRQGAIASMLTGLVLDAVLSIIPLFMGKSLAWSGYLPFGIHPVIWSVIAASLVMYFVSVATQPTEQQLEVFAQCNNVNHEIELSTPKQSLVNFTFATFCVGVLVLGVVIWFATKVAIV